MPMKTANEQQQREALLAITCLLDAARDSLHRRAADEGWMSPAQMDASQAGAVAGIASSMLADALDRPPAATLDTLTAPVLPGEDPKLLIAKAAEQVRELGIALPELPVFLDGLYDLIGRVHDLEGVRGRD
jgi:hypothetical protein